MDYKLLIAGEWVGGGTLLEVTNKYNGKVIGTLPAASSEMLDAAIAAAERAEDVMAEMPAHKRADILLRTAALIRERADDLAKTIAAEAGKAMKFARAEVDRAARSPSPPRKPSGCTARPSRWMPSRRERATLAFSPAVP